ncbi:MAG: hypothetical protein ACYCXT_07835 [Acidiferrobacteraceae bacterium]
MRIKAQAQGLTALSWDQVDRIMERAVTRGVARRSLEGLRTAGLDEKSFGKGHDYVSVLHDLVGRGCSRSSRNAPVRPQSRSGLRFPRPSAKALTP